MSITFRGCTGEEVYDTLKHKDERESAYVFRHLGGSACVYICLYNVGHSLTLHAIPRIPLFRWLVLRGIIPWRSWSFQVEYKGSSMSTSAATKLGAIARAKTWIEEKVGDELLGLG